MYGELDEKARVLVVHHRLPDARVRGNVAVGHLSLTTDVIREEVVGTVRDVEHTVLSTGWTILPLSETTDVGRVGWTRGKRRDYYGRCVVVCRRRGGAR